MDEIIALLQFAVNNERNFTEHDPDGVKRAWIKSAKDALAAQQNVQADADCPSTICSGKMKKYLICDTCGFSPHPRH